MPSNRARQWIHFCIDRNSFFYRLLCSVRLLLFRCFVIMRFAVCTAQKWVLFVRWLFDRGSLVHDMCGFLQANDVFAIIIFTSTRQFFHFFVSSLFFLFLFFVILFLSVRSMSKSRISSYLLSLFTVRLLFFFVFSFRLDYRLHFVRSFSLFILIAVCAFFLLLPAAVAACTHFIFATQTVII